MSFQRALTRVLSGQINFKHKQCSRIGGFVKELQRKAVIHRCSEKAVRKIVNNCARVYNLIKLQPYRESKQKSGY